MCQSSLVYKGKCTNVVTACATGTNCIGDALRAIQYGDAEVMFAGGTESCICPTAVAGFTALTALTTAQDPDRASIPFDKERGGFVLGEGAGVVVLEELEHAKQEVPIFMQSWWAMVLQAMLIISHPLQRTAAVPPKLWNWPWKRQALLHLKYSISMPMVQVPITMIFLRQRQLKRLLARMPKILSSIRRNP